MRNVRNVVEKYNWFPRDFSSADKLLPECAWNIVSITLTVVLWWRMISCVTLKPIWHENERYEMVEEASVCSLSKHFSWNKLKCGCYRMLCIIMMNTHERVKRQKINRCISDIHIIIFPLVIGTSSYPFFIKRVQYVVGIALTVNQIFSRWMQKLSKFHYIKQ